MRQVQHTVCILLLLLINFSVFAQVTHSDVLKNKYSPELLPSLIMASNQWKPFPKSAADWKKSLPDTVISLLINRGEQAAKKSFYNIPASVTLEFVKTGNRTDYETLSFNKRNQLWDLVLAESVEGKGRFINQIADGIWSICEETFWGINAHIGMQKAGAGYPT